MSAIPNCNLWFSLPFKLLGSSEEIASDSINMTARVFFPETKSQFWNTEEMGWCYPSRIKKFSVIKMTTEIVKNSEPLPWAEYHNFAQWP